MAHREKLGDLAKPQQQKQQKKTLTAKKSGEPSADGNAMSPDNAPAAGATASYSEALTQPAPPPEPAQPAQATQQAAEPNSSQTVQADSGESAPQNGGKRPKGKGKQQEPEPEPTPATDGDGDVNMSFEPDFHSLWSFRDSMEAKKKEAGVISDDEEEKDDRRVFYRERQKKLPDSLKFLEDRHLYPDYLAVDKEKKFPLQIVYGGEQAYRASDRPMFQLSTGKIMKHADPVSALIVLKDSKDDDKLVAFGYPFRATQKDSSKDPAVPPRQKKDNDDQPAPEDSETPADTNDKTETPTDAHAEDEKRLDDDNGDDDDDDDEEPKKSAADDEEESVLEEEDDDVRSNPEEEPLTVEEEEPLTVEEEESQPEEPKSTDDNQTSDKMDVEQDPVQASGSGADPPQDDGMDIDELDPKWLKVVYKTDSQRPGVNLSFCLDRATNEREVSIDFLAQHVESTENSIGIQLSMGGQHGVLRELPTGKDLDTLDGNLASLAKKGDLWRTDVTLKHPNCFRITGVTREEATAIRKKDPSQLTDGERLLITLSTAKDFSIFVQTPKKEQAAMAPFFKFYKTVMYAAAHLGNFWWYALVTTGRPDALRLAGYPFEKIPVPRWMIKSWRIEYYGNERYAEPQSAVMSTCIRYTATGESGLTPDEFAFLNRLAVAREAQKVRFELDKLFVTENRIEIVATFALLPDEKHYIVNLRFQEAMTADGQPLSPHNGTPIKVFVSTGQGDLTINGTVVDDVLNERPNITVFGKSSKPDAPKVTDRTQRMRARVEFPEFKMATNRELNAISGLQVGQSNRELVNLSSVAFGAADADALSYNKKGGYVMDKIKKDPARAEAYSKELSRHTLNEHQRAALDLLYTSPKGITLCWGPFGTGKTEFMLGAIGTAAASDFRILVTGPTNESVDLLAKRFAAISSIPETAWARFTGDTAKVELRPDAFVEETTSVVPHVSFWDDKVLEGNEEAEAAAEKTIFNHVLADSNPSGFASQAMKQMGYSSRKLQWIEGIVKQGPGPDKTTKERYDKAVEYLHLVGELRAAHLAGNRGRKSDRTAFNKADDAWNAVYLRQEMRVILATNNSSCHETLVAYYSPSIHLMDEAGLSSPADTVVPWAAFKDKIAVTMLTGDFKQGKPVVTSQGASECDNVISKSLFQKLWEDPRMADCRTVLREQYRMTPYLSKFPREHIYKSGDLIDAPSVQGESTIQVKARYALGKLTQAGLWNGNPRLGIDCFGVSEFEGQSTFNEKEAEMANFLVQFATCTMHVEPEKILVVSPYKAQRNLIRNKLRENVFEAPSKVAVKATLKAQGDQGNIVIVSLARAVKGNANDLGFIIDPELFTVQITRPRDWLFILGNLKAYMEIIKTNNKVRDMFLWEKCKLFRTFMQDLIESGDVIAAEDMMQGLRFGKVPRPVFSPGMALITNAPPKKFVPGSIPAKRSAQSKSTNDFSQRREETTNSLKKMRLGATAPAASSASNGTPGASAAGASNATRGRGNLPGTGKRSLARQQQEQQQQQSGGGGRGRGGGGRGRGDRGRGGRGRGDRGRGRGNAS